MINLDEFYRRGQLGFGLALIALLLTLIFLAKFDVKKYRKGK